MTKDDIDKTTAQLGALGLLASSGQDSGGDGKAGSSGSTSADAKQKKKKGTQNANDNSTKKKGGATPAKAPKELRWNDALQADYDRIVSVGEECIASTELKTLLSRKGRANPDNLHFNLYDGFEPSGRMHIAQGVFKAVNVNKCTLPQGTNATFIFWVADWFALMNDKMGGDLDKIKVVGHYLIEVWKAAGMCLDNVTFKWASDEITTHAATYWPLMLDVARRFNITRIKKCCQIMGRLEGSLTAAQVLYPLMQCTDVFFLKADICQLGVDQRKVNMLAREYCDACPGRKFKPIILSHHMLYGLKAGQEKMSKSDPDSAIFMEDAAADVERKILAAYCPRESAEVEATEASATTTTDATTDNDDDAGKASMHLTEDTLKNPCLDYIQHIIMSVPGATFTAGGTTYTDYAAVKHAFLVEQTLSEQELKQGLVAALNALLEPVRQHFTKDDSARDLLSKVRQYKKETVAVSKSAASARRLDLVGLKKVAAGSHLVFAPLACANPTYQQVVDLHAQITMAQGGSSSSQQHCVLMFSDWTSRVTNACQADVKAIAAYEALMVTALGVLDPSLTFATEGGDESSSTTTTTTVQVLRQSDAILTDPSNYWISVINVGRHFSLDRVMGASLKDGDGVGHVIGRLMRVADVAGVAPASVALLANMEPDGGVAQLEQDLITEFFTAKLSTDLTTPTIRQFSSAPIRLHPERECEALVTENDEYYLIDDPKVHGKSKLKKAFCEPGNVKFCPPIALTSVFAFGLGFGGDGEKKLVVRRSPENGGDKEYTSAAEIETDFASGALHPGDLKASVTALMVNVLTQMAAGIKADPGATKAVKDLKAFQKKSKKNKKT